MAFKYTVGLYNVGSYQVSGIPYITGAMGPNGLNVQNEVKHEFPQVAKSVTVVLDNNLPAKTDALRVHHTSMSASSAADWEMGRHWYTLSSSGDSVTINVRCKEIWLSSVLKKNPTSGDFETLPADTSVMNKIAYTIVAELTEVPRDRMYELTGSGLTD